MFKLYYNLPPISQTIRVRQAMYFWRSKNKLISDVFLWTPTHGHTRFGWPAKTYINHLTVQSVCYLGDLPRAMTDADVWRERIKGNLFCQHPWWWWWFLPDIFLKDQDWWSLVFNGRKLQLEPHTLQFLTCLLKREIFEDKKKKRIETRCFD